MADESATLTRSRWNRTRIRTIVFWATTFIVVFELTAGSVWNLTTIEWIEVQFHHLGYPKYLAYILGAWQAGAAVVIIAPRLALMKEWAYAGSIFLWSGAVASHLAAGDGAESWRVPLIFATCAIASWMLRPADRRFPETRFRPDLRRDGAGAPETRPRDWAVPIGLLVALYAISFASLPAIERAFHKRAIDLGWIDK
jgi:hypothetical protein